MTGPMRVGHRRWWWLGAILAVGLAVVVGVVVLSTDTSPPNPCDMAERERTGVTRPVAQPSTGGGLRVAEKGFSELRAERTVSLGAVVENTSTMVAYRTRIKFRVFDTQHRSAVPATSGELLNQEIPVILPGQRIGVGAWTHVREARFEPVKISGFDIELGAPQWWPRDNDVHIFRPISTHHQRTDREPFETGGPESGTIRYSVDSAFCRAFAARGVATVFRDKDGVLIGGSLEVDHSKDRCVPGRYFESVQAFRSLPSEIDDSRTESYPYCDPAPFTPNPTVTDRPIN